jgi:trehalose 6-phosphate synthase/phosphatase
VNKSYRNSSSHRLIVLDWGGTLVAENDTVDTLQAYAVARGIGTRSGPTEILKSTLEALCSDPKNTVFVVSGKEMLAVSAFFGDVKGLGLGAEHGFYYRWPVIGQTPVPIGSPRSSFKLKWQAMLQLSASDQLWKDPAKKLMELYTDRTHGTYIEQKGNALLWQFSDADPEFGYIQSKELEEHLTELMADHSVDVIRGGGVSGGYIEIRPAGVSKGLFLKHALDVLESQKVQVDFLLAIGDDSSDEPMFEQIQVLKSHENLTAYSVAVGKKPTAARAYVDDPAAVLELITTLTKSNALVRGYGSSAEIFSSSDRLTRASSDRLASKTSGANLVRSASVGIRMHSTDLEDSKVLTTS